MQWDFLKHLTDSHKYLAVTGILIWGLLKGPHCGLRGPCYLPCPKLELKTGFLGSADRMALLQVRPIPRLQCTYSLDVSQRVVVDDVDDNFVWIWTCLHFKLVHRRLGISLLWGHDPQQILILQCDRAVALKLMVRSAYAGSNLSFSNKEQWTVKVTTNQHRTLTALRLMGAVLVSVSDRCCAEYYGQ